MSYAGQSLLNSDQNFISRVQSAIVDEARTKVDDSLADAIMASPPRGAMMFMPWISSAPGFAGTYQSEGQAAILDADILAAVQAEWGQGEQRPMVSPPLRRR